VASVNSGTSSLTADSCAGCHRAHTAQGEFLLAAASEEALCLSCHNGLGATTNVEDGIQYVPAGLAGAGNILGALRDGGYVEARIGTADAARIAYPRTQSDISQRPKVPVGATGEITSAHIDLTGLAGNGIADKGRVWGSGAQGQLGATPVNMTCVECHNPHGNSQYRIVKPVPGISLADTDYGVQATLDVVGTFDLQNVVKTDTQHGFVVNDQVTFSGVGGGLTDGTVYYVRAVPNGFTFTVATSAAAASVVDLTNSTGGTVVRVAGGVADSPVDPDGNPVNGIENPTKNYTVLQVKGSQGVNSTYLLYARDVVAAAAGNGVAADSAPVAITSSTANYLQAGTAHGLSVGDIVDITGASTAGVADGTYTVASVTSSGALYDRFTVRTSTAITLVAQGTLAGEVIRQGITGNYTETGGDYFRRTIPWNPALVNTACNNSIYSNPNSTDPVVLLSAAACGTANDAPNGRPSAVTGVSPSALTGQKAFLDEMSTWCASCHTRYYSASNENLGNHPVLSPQSDIVVNSTVAATDEIRAASTPAFGDRVTFTDMADTALNTGEWYVVQTGTTSGTNWFKVSATLQGAAFDLSASTATGRYTRVYQSSNSSWGYDRYDDGTVDNTYKFQHSTASNRACTVCHVSHGSNAAMPGEAGTTYSSNFPYPDASTSGSSRLLKVDNRGTCQLCHDPTGTVTAGTMVGTPNTSIP
jgi:predicted CXXCH cytochrome family protein